MLTYWLRGNRRLFKNKHVCAGKAVCVSGMRDVLSVEQVFQKKVTGHDRVDKELI